MEARDMRTSSSSPMAVQAAIFILFFLISLLLQSPAAFGIRYAIPPAASPPIPNPSDAAATARWLVAKNSWGVISTISVDLKGAPFGEVVSYSDGEPGHGFGVPYFYLSQLEPTLKDASTDDRAALTLSEVPLGTCRKDPQDPTCAKITLNGKLKWISREDPELKLAQVALFTKHPEMQDWPKNHQFEIYKLELESIFLLDEYGGPMSLTPQEYLKYPSVF